MTSFALTTTTIYRPDLLWDYARDAKAHSRDIKIVVAGDLKTPPAAAELCARIARETGVESEYLCPAEQNALLAPHPQLALHLPWNSVQRRNAAFLRAWRDGADIIVAIDDDNFLADADYFGAHLIVGQKTEIDCIGKSGEWVNICQFLREADGRKFFPRGYSQKARLLPHNPPVFHREKSAIAVNAGLWLGDPDIDAVTRLSAPIDAISCERKDNFALAKGAWTPFNSQNTALVREAMPAYFMSPYVGRYDDIWASYICKRIADHLDARIAFGRPLVRQDRNPHDLWRDAALERMGATLTDDFVGWLDAAALKENDWANCAAQLMDALDARIAEANLPIAYRRRLLKFTEGNRLWIDALI